MRKYTPIPWFKNEYRQVFGSNGRRVCVDGFAFGTHSTEESQANSRRIVACINACEGFSDEELEGADLFKDSIESDAEIIALRQQRDELLAALRGLRDAFIGTSVEVQADAMRAARAAIAKAGGAV